MVCVISFTANYLYRYIMFYLDLVGCAETISLLYHLAMKGKTVRDSESHSHSQVCVRLGQMGKSRN